MWKQFQEKMTEAAASVHQAFKDPLIEIQWILYSIFGYDCYEKKWYIWLCENHGGHTVIMENFQFNCHRCGKKNL